MSLAEELLADLEEPGQDEIEDVIRTDIEDVSDVVMQVDTNTDSVRSIAKLLDSKQVCACDFYPGVKSSGS